MSKNDNLTDLPELAGLSQNDISMILMLLVTYQGELGMVQQEFERMTKKSRLSEGKWLQLSTIKQISNKYSKKVEEQEKKLEEAGELSPLARPSFRYRMLSVILKEAMKEKLRKSARVMDENIGIYDVDLAAATRAIDVAQKMYMDLADLDMKRAALEQIGAEEPAAQEDKPTPKPLSSGVDWDKYRDYKKKQAEQKLINDGAEA